jgi:hypothetical protein
LSDRARVTVTAEIVFLAPAGDAMEAVMFGGAHVLSIAGPVALGAIDRDGLNLLARGDVVRVTVIGAVTSENV